MEPIEVTIGSVELKVMPGNGVIEGGEIQVESIYVEFIDEQYLELDEQIPWNEDEVKEAVRSSWMENGEWPDTSTSDWDSQSVVNPGTVKWEILEYLWDNQPATNNEVGEELDIGGAASAYASDMKDDNLVKPIGFTGRSQIMVVTHVGAKELYTVNGPSMTEEGAEGESGLSSLFQNASVNKEESDDQTDGDGNKEAEDEE